LAQNRPGGSLLTFQYLGEASTVRSFDRLPVYFQDGFCPTEQDFLNEQEYWHGLIGWAIQNGSREAGLVPTSSNPASARDYFEVVDSSSVRLLACAGMTFDGRVFAYDAQRFAEAGLGNVDGAIDFSEGRSELDVRLAVEGLAPGENGPPSDVAAFVAPKLTLVTCPSEAPLNANVLVLGRLERKENAEVIIVDDFIPTCGWVSASALLNDTYENCVILLEEVANGLKAKREGLLQDPTSLNSLKTMPALEPVRYHLIALASMLRSSGEQLSPRRLLALMKTSLVLLSDLWENPGFDTLPEFRQWQDSNPGLVDQLAYDPAHCAPQFAIVRVALESMLRDIEQGSGLLELLTYNNKTYRLLPREILPADPEKARQGLFRYETFKEQRSARDILLLLPKNSAGDPLQGAAQTARIGLNTEEPFAMYNVRPVDHEEASARVLAISARSPAPVDFVSLMWGENPQGFESRDVQVYTAEADQ